MLASSTTPMYPRAHPSYTRSNCSLGRQQREFHTWRIAEESRLRPDLILLHTVAESMSTLSEGAGEPPYGADREPLLGESSREVSSLARLNAQRGANSALPSIADSG